MLLREQKELLVSRLRQMSSCRIAFHTPTTPHTESVAVRDELRSLFEKAGWTQCETGTSVLADVTPGIAFYRLRNDPNDSQYSLFFERLSEAFQEAGVPMTCEEVDGPSSGAKLVVAVGRLS